MKFEPDDDSGAEIHYDFTLTYGEDEKTIMLSLEISETITPDEYIQLLKEYIRHMETLINFKEESQLN